MLPGFIANTRRARRRWSAPASRSAERVTAWLVTNRRFPGARFFEWALLLPLAMPSYVMAYAYTDWLDYAGPVQSALRRSVRLVERRLLVSRRALARRRRGDVHRRALSVRLPARAHGVSRASARRSIEAARTLGLDARRAFWRIDLPLARPAIAGGIALALMETLADYGTVAYFAVDTFTTGIYRAWFSLGDQVAAAQLAAALLAFVVAAVLLERWSRGAARTASVNRMRSPKPPAQPAAHGLARRCSPRSICALPIVIGFVAARVAAAPASRCRSPDCPAPRASANWPGTASASPA